MINLDDMGDHYSGVAFLLANSNPPLSLVGGLFQLPPVVVRVKTNNKAKTFKFNIFEIGSVNPQNMRLDTWDNVKQFFPAVSTFPNKAEVRGQWNAKHLTLKYKTNVDTSGSAKLFKSEAGAPSQLKSMIKGWEEFKIYVSKLEKRRYLFRGQDVLSRLRTRFHRAKRADLNRFLRQDVQTLNRRLSLRTRHIYNLEIPEQNGAFLNLVQHHGYPTPLLDWTYSPYVAAFFAYRTIGKGKAVKASEDDKVRLFLFDHKQWHEDVPSFPWLDLPFPHFSVLEFMAIDNDRLIPQQAVSSVTNVDDIETHIKQIEQRTEKTYLQAIDLPLRARKDVIEELSYMGITAGSLFPGLDGACEELRERAF
jgi:hypothetical protein